MRHNDLVCQDILSRSSFVGFLDFQDYLVQMGSPKFQPIIVLNDTSNSPNLRPFEPSVRCNFAPGTELELSSLRWGLPSRVVLQELTPSYT